MSDTREMRDTLEAAQAELRRTKTHLDKLRAHQARERESLQREVEAARREVAELRARLEGLEARAQLPVAAPVQAPPLPVVERPGPAPTALVALVRWPEPLEEALPLLARRLGLSAADVRLRLAALTPAVLTRVPASEAQPLREALQAEGFVAVSCEVPPRAAGGLLGVRRFTLDEQELQLEGTMGERQRVPYSELRLLVRGRRTTTTVEERLEWAVSENARGLKGMGGRGRPDATLERFEVKHDHHSQFLWAYAESGGVAFSQGTQFNGLGARRGLSLTENLLNLGKELRQRAPQAVVDERLLGQPRFSLPLVEPERSQELFAQLLLQAVRQGVWA